MHIFLRLHTILQANSIKKRKLSEAIIISANDLPTHYMRQCLLIVDRALQNRSLWNLNRNLNIFLCVQKKKENMLGKI